MAVCGMRLFMVANEAKRPPGKNNEPFQNFLSLVWEIATGERDDRDWANSIRVAQQKKIVEGSDDAHISALLRADVIIDRAERLAGGRESPN